MAWYAVYEKATGKLVSTGTVLGKLSPDLDYKEYQSNPKSGTNKIWDPSILAFVDRNEPSNPDLAEALSLISGGNLTSAKRDRVLLLILKKLYRERS